MDKNRRRCLAQFIFHLRDFGYGLVDGLDSGWALEKILPEERISSNFDKKGLRTLRRFKTK